MPHNKVRFYAGVALGMAVLFTSCNETSNQTTANDVNKTEYHLNEPEPMEILARAIKNFVSQKSEEIKIISNFKRSFTIGFEAKEVEVQDECLVRTATGRLEWTRKSGDIRGGIVADQIRKSLKTNSNGLNSKAQSYGSISPQDGEFDLSVVIDSSQPDDHRFRTFSLAVNEMEKSVGHRLILSRLVVEKELVFAPAKGFVQALDRQSCGRALDEKCFVVEWKTEYFGDKLTYKAWIAVNDFTFRKISETFVSGDRDKSVLTEEVGQA